MIHLMYFMSVGFNGQILRRTEDFQIHLNNTGEIITQDITSDSNANGMGGNRIESDIVSIFLCYGFFYYFWWHSFSQNVFMQKMQAKFTRSSIEFPINRRALKILSRNLTDSIFLRYDVHYNRVDYVGIRGNLLIM